MLCWATYDALSASRPRKMRDMVYALWDTRTTNLIAAYDNERDALALVLSGIERNGPHDTDTLVLEVERTSFEAAGIPSTAVLDFVRSVERHEHLLVAVHDFMLFRHGNVAAEGGSLAGATVPVAGADQRSPASPALREPS